MSDLGAAYRNWDGSITQAVEIGRLAERERIIQIISEIPDAIGEDGVVDRESLLAAVRSPHQTGAAE